MSDLYFPRSLKPVVSKGYSMTRRNNVWSVDLAGGGVRQGRDTYYDVFPVSVTLITSAMGRQAFLSFLEKVDGGASSFWMAHDFGMGIEDYQVTITSTIAESTEDGINWTITFTATAEKSPFQDLENQCLINNLPDLYGCYGDCLGSFLKIYANYETTFPRICSNEGPAGYPPINLLASALDSRIVYEGPQVYHINRNGNLVPSAANEWPLTFIDGVAVGRVPPEGGSINYQIGGLGIGWVHTFNRIPLTSTEDSVYQGNLAGTVTPTAENNSHFLYAKSLGDSVIDVGETYTATVILKANGIQFIQVYWNAGRAGISSHYSNFDLINKAVSGTATSAFITEISDGWVLCSTTTIATGDGSGLSSMSVASIPSMTSTRLPSYASDGASSFSVASAQVEKKPFATSPIVTDASPSARQAASAKVVMSGAASIDITYSDGTVVNVQAVDDYAAIPQADSSWGSKYITRIDFNVDG